MLPSVLMTPEVQRIAAVRRFPDFAAAWLWVLGRLLRGARDWRYAGRARIAETAAPTNTRKDAA